MSLNPYPAFPDQISWFSSLQTNSNKKDKLQMLSQSSYHILDKTEEANLCSFKKSHEWRKYCLEKYIFWIMFVENGNLDFVV